MSTEKNEHFYTFTNNEDDYLLGHKNIWMNLNQENLNQKLILCSKTSKRDPKNQPWNKLWVLINLTKFFPEKIFYKRCATNVSYFLWTLIPHKIPHIFQPSPHSSPVWRCVHPMFHDNIYRGHVYTILQKMVP